MIRSDFGRLIWPLVRETRLSQHIMNDNFNSKWTLSLWAINDHHTNRPIIIQLNRRLWLFITITISFKGPNNLEILIYKLREENRRDQLVNYNPSTNFTKSLNWIKVMLVQLVPRSVILINLNGMGQLESFSDLIKI